MFSRSVKIYSIGLIFADFLTLLLAFGLAYILRVHFDHRPLVAQISAMSFFVSSLAIIPFWSLTFAMLGLYQSNIYNRRLAEFGRLLIGSLIGILVVLGYSFVIDRPVFPARLVAVYSFGASFILLVIAREAMRQLRTLLFRYGRGIRRVLLIGTTPVVADIALHLDDTMHSGYKIVAIAAPDSAQPAHFKGHRYPTAIKALEDVKRLRITTIIQTDLYDSPERNQKILSAAQTHHIAYSFIPGEPEFYSGKNTVDVFLGYPIISVYQTPLIGWGVVVKRIFDFVVSILAIVILSPVFLLLVLLQKLLNPGPVLIQLKRMTLFGKQFGLVKFRSMRRNFGKHDAIDDFKKMGREDLAREYVTYRKIKSEPDPRITWFGHFLRRTSLDELPQLFNVLSGEMSLVGPRPIEPVEIDRYKGRASLLHSVKPGITGLWQVSGRNELTFDQRVELELYYAQNWTFWLDIKILFKTIPVLLKKTGAQ
ncbi:MAG TPA: sugar transferase [Candidatus Acidoferrum sp.]|nr:sugar transferase [Candidatus Acidoferrum sp.]